MRWKAKLFSVLFLVELRCFPVLSTNKQHYFESFMCLDLVLECQQSCFGFTPPAPPPHLLNNQWRWLTQTTEYTDQHTDYRTPWPPQWQTMSRQTHHLIILARVEVGFAWSHWRGPRLPHDGVGTLSWRQRKDRSTTLILPSQFKYSFIPFKGRRGCDMWITKE